MLLAHHSAAYSDCTLTPVIPDRAMADRFGGAQTALLQLSELTRADSGTHCQPQRGVADPDAFTFQLRRRRDN